MDSRVPGLNPQTPDSAKVVHYYGSHEGGGRPPPSPNSRTHAANPRLHHHKTDALLLLLRLVTFALSLASLVLMATNSRPLPTQPPPHQRASWLNFDAYRYVFAASAIVCIYSLAEIGLGMWYLYKGRMLMPASLAHWFDFGHDQGFAYLIFSACSAGTAVAQNLREGHILLIHGVYGCQQDARSFCTQAEISIGLAFGAFLLIALSSLLSGFRLARWLINAPF